MAALTGTFEDVGGENRRNVRKMTKLAVFTAPETVDPIETILDSSNQLVIPDGYESVGHVARDPGATITPSLDISDLLGYNAGTPIRRDIVTRTTAVQFTGLETKRRTMELWKGQDLSAVQATAGPKNEIVFDDPDLPDLLYWRLLLLGRDGRGANAIYFAEHYLLCTLSDVGERTWSPTDGFTWPVTLAPETDDDAGTPVRTFMGGPGLTDQKILEMGFVRGS
jgi:hypothetical protein